MNELVVSSRVQLVRMFLRDIRSPRWGLAGQGIRFALAAGVVLTVYVSVTTILHNALDVSFQIALASGFVASVAVHFTLQRLFVWRHHEDFALRMRHQVLRYLFMCVTQYSITALATSQLPELLSLPVEVVYAMTIVAVAAVNFAVFRGRVFHPSAVREERSHV